MFPRAKKSFGQNFLTDRSTVKRILEAAEIAEGDVVLEIGPGTGVLTEALVEAGAKVTAIEADRDLIPELEAKFGDALTLIAGNALTAPHGLKGDYKLVANIPYNITSAIIEKFLAHEPRPTRMVLMVQREVADRMVAAPPEMSILAVACQIYAKAKKVFNVPRGAFRPVPKVDSAVVRLDLFPLEGGEEEVISLVKAGFAHPRKQLHGNLASAGFGTSDEMKYALTSLGLNPLCRAETLTVEQWKELHGLLRKP